MEASDWLMPVSFCDTAPVSELRRGRGVGTNHGWSGEVGSKQVGRQVETETRLRGETREAQTEEAKKLGGRPRTAHPSVAVATAAIPARSPLLTCPGKPPPPFTAAARPPSSPSPHLLYLSSRSSRSSQIRCNSNC